MRDLLRANVLSIFRRLMDDDKPDKPKYTRVKGSRILSPSGKPVFFKVATWENPFEGTVSEKRVKEFMNKMKTLNLNCILLKGNMWLVHDNLKKNQHNVNVMHRLIRHAESRGIYVILNLFDVWSRGLKTNEYDKNPNRHPINVWHWGHRFLAADFTKWVTREFIRYPMLIFELGNEMEHNDWKQFKRVARMHILPHFYNIAKRDRPIGVSQQQLWDLPVTVLFNHKPMYQGQHKRPVITNELAHHTDLWNDAVIRDPARSPEYFAAFKNAKDRGHCGVAAATILNINKPLEGAALNVLTQLGKY